MTLVEANTEVPNNRGPRGSVYECQECSKEYGPDRPSTCSCGGHSWKKIW